MYRVPANFARGSGVVTGFLSLLGITLALTNTISGVYEMGRSTGRYENKFEKNLT